MVGILKYIIEHKNAAAKPINERKLSPRAGSDFKDRVPAAIVSVNERFCAVNHGLLNVRNIFFPILLLGLCALGYLHVDYLVGDWRNEESHFIHFIAILKKRFGEDFYKTSKDPVVRNVYNYIDANGRMPIKTYLRYRYFEVPAATHFLVGDVVMVMLYLPFIPWLFYVLLRFPRYAPLFFDRDRKLVWTWRRGRVWALPYESLRVHESVNALYFGVCELKKNGQMRRRLFAVDLPGSPYFVTLESREAVLEFVVRFMESGKTSVYTGPDFEKRPGAYLFEDKKPKDEERQIERILQLSEREEGNPPRSFFDAW